MTMAGWAEPNPLAHVLSTPRTNKQPLEVSFVAAGVMKFSRSWRLDTHVPSRAK